LVENGTELIEVKDNGPGIDPENFEFVAMRHATSKIRKFDDLESLNTFGFRGEALAALAAISTLRISTKTKDEKIGSEIEFEPTGKVKTKKIKVQSNSGTTVQVRVKYFFEISLIKMCRLIILNINFCIFLEHKFLLFRLFL
jgi:DNA mismatch repair protein PMS2